MTAELDPVIVEGLGRAIGAQAAPERDVYADLGRRTVDPDLAKIARARAKEVRAAFVEGVEMGSGGFSPYPEADLWRRSDALKRLTSGPAGFDVVGIWAVCSDPRAAGRDYWRVAGVWKGRAWIQSEGVDLIVQLASLRRCVDLKPLTISDTTVGGA